MGPKWVVFGFVLVAWFEAMGAPAPVFARMTGVLEHEATRKQQLAKLDFIVSKTNTNDLELKAVLTLHFGDFASGEYVSFHYDRVRYDLINGTLVFADPDQPLSIFVRSFSGKEFEGEAVSVWGGNVGKLTLSAETGDVRVSAPLVEPVWGEYTGACGPHRGSLKLYTMRSTVDQAHLAQPFGSYDIKASLSLDCKDGTCSNLRFDEGAYNYFLPKDQLSLVGKRQALRCSVNGSDVTCRRLEGSPTTHYDLSNCVFKRVPSPEKMQLSPIQKAGAFQEVSRPLTVDTIRALQSGEYKGYVFNEYQGVYQPASLNLTVFQAGTGPDGGTRISAFARLFYGKIGSTEVNPYSFAEKLYPNPLTGPQNLVFSRIDANLDAVVQITEFKDGTLRGNWYSILFGRVGPFEMRLDDQVSPPEGARVVQSLSGLYREIPSPVPGGGNPLWNIWLQVVPGVKPPGTTENPFFPNFIKGNMQLDDVTPSLQIGDASYDFYTGRFGFMETQDDGKDHTWIGVQVSRDELQLHHVSGSPIGPSIRQVPRRFRLVKEHP